MLRGEEKGFIVCGWGPRLTQSEEAEASTWTPRAEGLSASALTSSLNQSHLGTERVAFAVEELMHGAR